MVSVFGFWTKGIGPHGGEFPKVSQQEWCSFDPEFTVYDDEAVLDALSHWPESSRELYSDIRIPACRSDIARLALLSAFGGTYIDGHTAPGNRADLKRHLHFAGTHDLVVPQFDADESPIRYNRIFNSPISGRKGAPILADLLRRAFGNLFYQRDKERETGRIDLEYSIFDLTGPNMIRDLIVDFSCWPFELASRYDGAIYMADLSKRPGGPFHIYRHGAYRSGPNHWTSREKCEPLFFSSEKYRSKST